MVGVPAVGMARSRSSLSRTGSAHHNFSYPWRNRFSVGRAAVYSEIKVAHYLKLLIVDSRHLTTVQSDHNRSEGACDQRHPHRESSSDYRFNPKERERRMELDAGVPGAPDHEENTQDQA